MRRTLIFAAAAGFAALPILTGPALAQANRTFVSGHGEDANPCSLAAPCRTFAQAITQTNAGGEIVVLDSAGYGALTINKSITITNPGGVEAGITQAIPDQTAIVINPSSSFVVTLRGLTLEGGGVGNAGIVLHSTAPGTLDIIDCVVKDFTAPGIQIAPTLNGGALATVNVLIANSFVLNNAGSGIEIFPQAGPASLSYVIDNTTVAGNGTSGNDAGILVNASLGALRGTISSVHADQNLVGVNVLGSNGVSISGISTIIKHSVLSNNGQGDLINNSGSTLFDIALIDGTEVDGGMNNKLVFTDGTNDIFALFGNAVQPIPALQK